MMLRRIYIWYVLQQSSTSYETTSSQAPRFGEGITSLSTVSEPRSLKMNDPQPPQGQLHFRLN